MSTAAQVLANRENCQKSTGPATEAGKASSCLNHFQHGLTGSAFSLLPWESEDEFDRLVAALHFQFQPRSSFEQLLVEKMSQHQWLSQRALLLQNLCFDPGSPVCTEEKQLALYLRYQTTHERAFHKYVDQLLKIRKEKRNTEIGFESQKRQAAEEAAKETRLEAAETRRQAEEARKQELHEAKVRLINSKAQATEFETDIRSTLEAPLPGNTPIPYEVLRDTFRGVTMEVYRQLNTSAVSQSA